MPRRPIATLFALAFAGLSTAAVATAHEPYGNQARYDSARYDYDDHGSGGPAYGDYRSGSLTSAYAPRGGYASYDVGDGRRQATNVPFDEQYYLQQNPDVARVVMSGAIRSGYEHWMKHGRFEGRSPAPGVPGRSTLREEQDLARERDQAARQNGGTLPFDEAYYLRQNPDVARDVRAGVLRNGYQHYLEKGQFEGRSPAPGIPGNSTAGTARQERRSGLPSRSIGSRF